MTSSGIRKIEVKYKKPVSPQCNSPIPDSLALNIPCITGQIEFAVNFCHQAGWSSPFYCTKNCTPKLSTSWWCKFMQYIILTVSILATSSQIFTIIMDVGRKSFSFHDLSGAYRLLCAFVFSFITIVQINLKWKSREVLELWKLFLNYIEKYHSDDSEELKRIDKQCKMLMKIFIVNFTLMPVCTSILYLFHCEFYIWSTVLPVCDEGNGGHKSVSTVLFSLGLTFIISAPAITCMAITSDIILVFDLMGHFILRNLKLQALKSEPNVLKRHKWNTSYRTFYMLNSRYQDCFQEVVTPFFFCLSTVIIIISNYLILTPNVAVLVKCLAITVCSAFVLYMLLVVQLSMFFPHVSEDILILRKGQCKSRNMYTSRLLRSCLPIRIFVRHFLYLTRDIIPKMVGFIITQTISALLA